MTHTAWAQRLAPVLGTDPDKNRSGSFRALCSSLVSRAPAQARPRKPKRFHHAKK